MTSVGGTAAYGGDGTVFSVGANGSAATVLHSFNFNGTDGWGPYGSLTLNGPTLYGMTPNGGTLNSGAIFSIPVTGGATNIMLSFSSTNGAAPIGSLILSGSALYGMTSQGGTKNDGTVFRINTDGTGFQTLLSFSGTAGSDLGSDPWGDLTLSGSTLYGMTQYGGVSNDGTVFSMPITGGSLTTLLSFSGSNGSNPEGNLILSGTTLYGMTRYGNAPDEPYNNGVIFSIPVTGGPASVLLSFSGSNGANPTGSLTLNGSTLYGMTAIGGATDSGTVFALNLNPTPEPSTFALLATGALALLAFVWRRPSALARRRHRRDCAAAAGARLLAVAWRRR
jgi:uncharacterized repeat protein (TIGR03803 family)